MAFNLADAEARYPDVVPFLNQPGILDLLTQASEGQWDQVKFTNALHQTQWWQTTPDALRQWEALQATDPAEASRRMQNGQGHFSALAYQLGIGPDGLNANKQISEQLWYMALQRATQLGLSDQDFTNQLLNAAYAGGAAGATERGGQQWTGTMGSTIGQLKQISDQWMIPTSQSMLAKWSHDIITGGATTDAFTEWMKAQAKGRWSSFSHAFDSGQTTAQVFEPYVQQAAQLLEVSPGQVDLMNDPQMSRMLEINDPKTGQLRPMTLSESASYIRGLPQWKNTAQANTQGNDMALNLLKTFGEVAA